jgi:predicted ATP-grasp superfamily ATP-dependent carboligase
MTQKRADVLLTYGWVRSSYAALRNLTAHGIQVCASDSSRLGMCQSSLLKVAFERYPSHYIDEEAFVQRIADICSEHSISLILPSHNETEILARHKHRFPGSLSALLPDASHCALFNNKRMSYDFARSLDVPVPCRVEYSDPATIANAIGDAGVTRTVIKLLTGNSAKGVYYAETPKAAQEISLRLIEQYDLEPHRYPQIEERVVGDGWGRSVLYWHGGLVQGFTHRRLREKLSTGGTSTLRESAVHRELEEAAKRIFDRVGWHGLAMAEFKVCPRSGRFWFIEVNPRMWGSIPLAISAGAEFPYLAWLCAMRGIEEAKAYSAQHPIRHPWRSRWLLGDALVALRQIFAGQLSAGGRTAWCGADAVDDFFWNDPFVLAGEALYYASNALRKRSLNPSEEGMLG